ncbi:MAG: cyclomaltodextrinase N-terminal domain-containing protein, partial [Pirellula sp.]
MSQKYRALGPRICCSQKLLLLIASLILPMQVPMQVQAQAQAPSRAESARASEPNPQPLEGRLVVTKVDPPSWWTGSSANPIRLLLTGQGLSTDLVLTADRQGLQFTNLKASQNGHFLFADLHIAPDCKPGPVQFELSRLPQLSQSSEQNPTTNPQRTALTWEVLEPPAHRPQGFGPEDFIYFLMPDRFCDGNP